MNDERPMNGEPLPDPLLRAALVDAFGEQPMVDWTAFSQRARSAAAFRLRAASSVAPWWEQVTPWVNRLLPVGALTAAAALALAMVTPRDAPATEVAAATASASYNADSRDAVADAIVGPNGTGAVAGVAGAVDDDWFWNATAVAHQAEPR